MARHKRVKSKPDEINKHEQLDIAQNDKEIMFHKSKMKNFENRRRK